jgi:P-type Cu2+ transporter
VRGTVGGRDYLLGAPRESWLRAGPMQDIVSARDNAGRTWIALSSGGQPLALFGLAAQLRPDAAAAVQALRDDGVQVILLSGDSEPAVEQLAATLGIAHPLARQSPEQKLERLRSLQQLGAVVMAVGDGINDAPLLAAADIGVAMPEGAALAQARADVILTGDALDGLRLLRAIGCKAARRVRENMAWALGYNILMLPLAFSGALTPWLAALGMSASSLVVVTNALRLGGAAAPLPRPPA